MHLIDTNIAIYLRDVDPEISARIDALPTRPKLSLLSWVELEGGIHTDQDNAIRRRTNLDAMLDLLEIVPFDDAVVRAYAHIVAMCGFSRPRILDRLIAGSAIVNGLTLITINASDFREIPGLALEIWPAPSAQ